MVPHVLLEGKAGKGELMVMKQNKDKYGHNFSAQVKTVKYLENTSFKQAQFLMSFSVDEATGAPV